MTAMDKAKIKIDSRYKEQKIFWERAGVIGYGDAIFANRTVEKHIISKQWETVMNTARAIGLNPDSQVLELGCGDGVFAENVLAHGFKRVDAFDISEAAVARAKANSCMDNVAFHAQDITTLEYRPTACWDGAFLVGFLHHVKPFAANIISCLSKVTPKVVVLEPNGDNLIRKTLEMMPSYRAAGEDSFPLRSLIRNFGDGGYSLMTLKKINFVPQFCPEFFYPALRLMERIIEPNPILNKACSTYVLGFQKNK